MYVSGGCAVNTHNFYLSFPISSVSVLTGYKCIIVVFQHANEDVERMLLGNKCDMEDKRIVPKAKGEQVSLANLPSERLHS